MNPERMGAQLLQELETGLTAFLAKIPDAETRTMLKKNGFKWSPTNNAWQRQLTPNAMRTLKRYVKLPNLVID